MDRYKPYDFEEFISELNERHQEARAKYAEAKKILQSKNIFNMFDNISNNENDYALCIAEDIYLDKPTGKKLKILQQYIDMVEALLELEDYLE